MVWTATLHVQFGALCDQQQLWENYFLIMFVRRRLWKDTTPLKRRKRPNVRARRPRLGSKSGYHGAGWCLPVRARSLETSAAKCSKRDGACEMGRRAYAPPTGAPTRRQMHQVGRGPHRRGSMRGGHWVPWCLLSVRPRCSPISYSRKLKIDRVESYGMTHH